MKASVRLVIWLMLLGIPNAVCSYGKDFPDNVQVEKGEITETCKVLAGDINTVSFSPEDFMLAFFGDYHPSLGISSLAPEDLNISDPPVLNLELYYDTDTTIYEQSQKHQELLTVLGKVPFEFVEMYSYPPDRYLMVFAVKSSLCGFIGHVQDIPVGMAVYKWDGTSWKCGHYDLEVGRYGVWGQVGSGGRFPISADNYAFLIGESIGVCHYYTLLDDKPALILSAYTFDEGDMYDTYNGWDSFESFIDTGQKYYDFVIESEADKYGEDGTIHHYRRYRFNEEEKCYRMIESRGDFTGNPDLTEEYDWSE
jgi:hypothetical protein